MVTALSLALFNARRLGDVKGQCGCLTSRVRGRSVDALYRTVQVNERLVVPVRLVVLRELQACWLTVSLAYHRLPHKKKGPLVDHIYH